MLTGQINFSSVMSRSLLTGQNTENTYLKNIPSKPKLSPFASYAQKGAVKEHKCFNR